MKKNKKFLITIAAVVLIICCAVGATVAYIVTKTDTVTNTFTAGNIDIDLVETTGENYIIVPGKEITKDPTITVEANSEASYLFVKVETTNDFNTYFDYAIADGWTALDNVTGVYWRETTKSTSDQKFTVLKDNKVTAKSDLEKDQLDAIGNNEPTLSFTAYAVQKDGISSASDAWAKVSQ